ncbi:hypothetical protein CCR83_14460 [Rhodobacter veldkampii DSM 11550]|uniref:Photosynthetic complex assembly protein n=1 Tax=Phaeovulum veldkampii DSM 11550 TaxID=1185920 RepID=A0A2T4JII9_9RHOB|nr:photosynthetic complex assembly protein PuhC [Phaeovulum veldkampii]MBK5947618.1 hypothetical protein [Phaeovulum veldkampii DSM 11550]NCU20278.1 photosynthetic complex assembly protein [Candidatus Falkowbacteria bacterium]PTE17731.1 photosynthetic complex assembly protein [Phaeovulum veldkampii DSM 11550]TDQ58201.1 putative photosynthetic complex assembly protein [Phaeovulum veldkampii DSM 11550]
MPAEPKFRHDPDKDLIPRPLLLAMGALVLVSLALVSYARLTGRETVGRPEPSQIVAERVISISGDKNAVTVRGATGEVLVDLENGGFFAVIRDGLSHTRRVHRIAMDKPVRLQRYANGRLVVHDPETGWSIELTAFGENKAAFARLLPE